MIGEYRRTRLVYNGQPTSLYINRLFVPELIMENPYDKASDSNPEGFENEKGQGNSPRVTCEYGVSDS